jgi:hypothetical protein
MSQSDFEHEPRVPGCQPIGFLFDERDAWLLCKEEQPETDVTNSYLYPEPIKHALLCPDSVLASKNKPQIDLGWTAHMREAVCRRLVSNPQHLVDGTTREGSNSVGMAFLTPMRVTCASSA